MYSKVEHELKIMSIEGI